MLGGMRGCAAKISIAFSFVGQSLGDQDQGSQRFRVVTTQRYKLLYF